MRSNTELSSPTEGPTPQNIPLLLRLDFLSVALKEQHYRDAKYITVYQLLKMNKEDEGDVPPSLNLKILPTVFFFLPIPASLSMCAFSLPLPRIFHVAFITSVKAPFDFCISGFWLKML